MPGAGNEDSSSDDSTASGLSASTRGTIPLSNMTTPDQGPDKMTQVKEEHSGLPCKDPLQEEIGPDKDGVDQKQSPTMEPTDHPEELEAKYDKALHKTLISQPFDIESMKLHMAERWKGKTVYKQEPREDSRDLKDMVIDMAQLRMDEASSLLAYVDNLEMKLLHLQNQIKSQEGKGAEKSPETMLRDAETIPRTKETPTEQTTGVMAAEAGEEEQPPIPSEHIATIPGCNCPLCEARRRPPSPELDYWKKEVKRKKRCKNQFGDVMTYDINEDVSSGLDGSKSRSGGHIMTHYRQLTEEAHTNQLEINSPLLIEALRTAIDHYAGDDFKALKGDTVLFDEPYMMLFHNRKKLVDHAETLEDEAKEHLMYLLDFMRQELPHASQKLDELEQKTCKTIDFNTLWLLYQPPEGIVFTRVGQEWRAFRVTSLGGFKQQANGVWSALHLTKTWMTMDSTGTGLVSCSEKANITNFDDEQLISSLDYIPQGYLLDEANTKKDLIARGEKYWSFREKPSFLDYTGNAWVKTMESDAARVIVDHRKYSLTGSYQLNESRLPEPCFGFDKPRPIPGCPCSSCARMAKDLESGYPDDETEVQLASLEEVTAHPDRTLLLLPHTVAAFSLRKKDWRDVEITKLRPVEFETKSFQKLVISKPHRKLVTAMAKSYFVKDTDFTDLVKGKGRGLIILLHGSPGTGKTLTAECVAEDEQRPLYMITCGDLGTEPTELETKIRSAFEDATRWGAVLLLDEADVFLQERDVRDLKRNALVSVFLRELEYFDGILFLTTNRPGLLDEAFQSRIHVTLHLNDLSVRDQLKIWLIFLREQNLQEKEVEHIFQELQKVCQSESLNGRQIRNNVRTATALAAADKKKLSMEQIRTVLEVGRSFATYRKELDGMDPRDRQAALGLRLKS